METVGNHYCNGTPPFGDLQPNAGSDNCWEWSAQDCSDGGQQHERLALKFDSAELATQFSTAFEKATTHNAALDDELRRQI